MKKLFIFLTLVSCMTFSSLILAGDFQFPGITTAEQVRLELWVYGPRRLKTVKHSSKISPELERSLKKLEQANLTN